MATIQKTSTVQNTQDFLRIQDLLYLCLAQWHWFLLSLTLCLGAAVIYLLRTPPVYTRTASILIKDDSKGSSTGADMGFADFGMFTSKTNIGNEMITLRSFDLMHEVVNRLHLDQNYLVDGRFHQETLYGTTLPIRVALLDLEENESAQCEIQLHRNGRFTLTDFVRGGVESREKIEGQFNDTLQSPIGRFILLPTAHYQSGIEQEITLQRSPIKGAAGGAIARLLVAQNDEKSNIITLTFQDVSTQRAEDVLNTLIAVYNENWVKDKNQIAISTSMFINDRLGVIEGELGNVDNDISSFKSQHLLPDVSAAASLYLSQANAADNAIQQLNNQIYMARYIRGTLTDESNRYTLLPANSGIDNANIASQISEYNNQLLERNNLVSKSSEKNPLVVEMDGNLTALRNALISTIDNQLVALDAQVKSQRRYGENATSQIASNPKQAKYLLSVERQQKVKEALYLFLLQKREENELSQAFTAYNTRIINKPDGSMAPTAPPRKNILLIALALRPLLPPGVIFIRESTNTVVRGKKDLDNLSVPFVGEIPLYTTTRKQWGFSRREPLQQRAMLVKEGSRNIINEAFRVLRTNIEFMVNVH